MGVQGVVGGNEGKKRRKSGVQLCPGHAQGCLGRSRGFQGGPGGPEVLGGKTAKKAYHAATSGILCRRFQ